MRLRRAVHRLSSRGGSTCIWKPTGAEVAVALATARCAVALPRLGVGNGCGRPAESGCPVSVARASAARRHKTAPQGVRLWAMGGDGRFLPAGRGASALHPGMGRAR